MCGRLALVRHRDFATHEVVEEVECKNCAREERLDELRAKIDELKR